MIILCPEKHEASPKSHGFLQTLGIKGMMKKALLVLLIACGSMGLKSQNALEIGAFGGISYYIGDINPGIPFKQIEPAYGLLGRYYTNTRWAFRFNLNMTDLTGDDLVVKHNEDRALNFRTRLYDASLIAEFNFFDYFTGSTRNYISPFIMGGISLFHFTPYDNEGNALRPQGNEGQFATDADGNRIGPAPYSQFGFSIPFGLGVKYSLTKRLGMAIEWRMHKTFTDYIDDISTVYYEDTQAPSGVLFEAGMQRGNRNANDWFSFAGVSLTYKFNLVKRTRCLELDGVQQPW